MQCWSFLATERTSYTRIHLSACHIEWAIFSCIPSAKLPCLYLYLCVLSLLRLCGTSVHVIYVRFKMKILNVSDVGFSPQFQKAESDLNYLSRKLELRCQNYAEGDCRVSLCHELYRQISCIFEVHMHVLRCAWT